VPAYLVVPPGKGPFAAVLYGHSAIPDSPVHNRLQFLEEATALAHAKAVSLLIDAPFARPGAIPDEDTLSSNNADLLFQQILDLRRGVDLLVSRPDVYSKRVAYVGHSYGASVGGILAGVEKRIKAFVLMAGVLSNCELASSAEPEVVRWKQTVSETRLQQYINTYGWLDPEHYIAKAAPAAVLLQYGAHDPILHERRAQYYYNFCSDPKTLKLYDAGHTLNMKARLDRVAWLRKRLRLRNIDPVLVEKVGESR